ncbi:MAG: hypothetical protein OXI76_13670 [Gemmatimonadota bacterium]|nr:hypothetical protein [Gemmatimonadota bacterium]
MPHDHTPQVIPGSSWNSGRRWQRKATRIGLFSCLAGALAACDAALDRSLVTRSDSAGIPIITAQAPVWGPGEGWQVSEEPLVRIGAVEGPREQLLDGVVGAVRLSNRDIVLGERTTGELRRYDPEGTLVWRAAGQGEGPGEHRVLMFVGLIPGDTVVTWDVRLNRVQLFDPEGAPVRAFRVAAPWSGAPPTGVIGVSGRRPVLTFNAGGGEPEDGIVRWPTVRIATLSLEDGSVRVVMDVPGPEVRASVDGAMAQVMEYPFGKGPRYSVAAGRLAVVDTERFDVRSVSLDDGAVTAILRRDEPVREVAEEDVDAYVEWMTDVSAGAGLHVPPGLAEQPMASTLPALKSIHLDAGGNLWVEPHSRHGSGTGPFQVYTPGGEWLGTVAVPSGLQQENVGLPVSFEIGDDYILGVWRDEIGVEYVRMYRLMK